MDTFVTLLLHEPDLTELAKFLVAFQMPLKCVKHFVGAIKQATWFCCGVQMITNTTGKRKTYWFLILLAKQLNKLS